MDRDVDGWITYESGQATIWPTALSKRGREESGDAIPSTFVSKTTCYDDDISHYAGPLHCPFIRLRISAHLVHCFVVCLLRYRSQKIATLSPFSNSHFCCVLYSCVGRLYRKSLCRRKFNIFRSGNSLTGKDLACSL